VWVVKTVGARPDHECTLGDGMAKTLFAVGCRGVVTDGGVRDVAGLLTVPFAAYAKGLTIHHGPLRFRNAGCPVEIGGITVQSGDVIHADEGGVIRIPAECLERLPAEAVRMQAFEREAHLMLRRTDLPPREKHRRVKALLQQYNFQQTCLASGPEGNTSR
jgi:4-hydroxy-4-methyl-2-oxoglutarate aldolase